MKGYLPAPAAVGDAHSPEVRRGAAGAPAAAAPRAPPGGRAGSGRRAGKRSRSRANPSAGVGLREEQGCSSSLRQAESPARAGGAGQLCQARGAPSGSARTRLARLGSARFGSAATRARSATRSSSVRSSTIRSGCNWFGMPRLGVVRFGSVQGSAPGLSATRLGAAGRSPHGAISGLAGRAGLAAGGAEGCVCVMEASVCVCVCTLGYLRVGVTVRPVGACAAARVWRHMCEHVRMWQLPLAPILTLCGSEWLQLSLIR